MCKHSRWWLRADNNKGRCIACHVHWWIDKQKDRPHWRLVVDRISDVCGGVVHGGDHIITKK